MNILYVSYWGIQEGLSAATVTPHVRILASFSCVQKVVLSSIERNVKLDPEDLGEKIQHVPLFSSERASVLATKINDFITFPRMLVNLCRLHHIDFIICRSSLAGALGFLVHQRTRIPYAVESFEPHSEYMAESGIWKKYDPRFLIQRYFERRIRQTARALLPVSKHYRDRLITERVPAEKIIVQPCCVNLDHLAFSTEPRTRIRNNYKIPMDAIVGIYVGKFGHMYYDVEAFELYAKAFQFYGDNFHLIILSADAPAMIMEYIRKFQLPTKRIVFRVAPHGDVKDYLSAADFAFATFRWAPSKKYLSPIKNAEYWANGLPILLESGIGDDSDIVQIEGGGVIVDIARPENAFAAMKKLIAEGREKLAEKIEKIAFTHRRLGLIRESYERLLNK